MDLNKEKAVNLILRHGSNIVLLLSDNKLRLPQAIPDEYSRTEQGGEFCFTIKGQNYICLEVKKLSASSSADLIEIGLREGYSRMDAVDYKAAGKGFELLHWDAHTRYCGVCGNELNRSTEISKKCPKCNYEVFAQVSPAIIVLIRKGEKALLVHARNFSRPFFGLVAGFVETGETLEECVCREVLEETSLRIKNIRYVASQAWPFPNSLMLGFTADYESGELKFADGELTEGGFFSADELPLLPMAPSIARALIESWRLEQSAGS